MDRLLLDFPAKRWGEGFPLGNGHMGMMYYGDVFCDRMDLSENTFFSGEWSEEHDREGAGEIFGQMRREIDEGAYGKAHRTAEAFVGRRKNYGTNLPVGTLRVYMTDQLPAAGEGIGTAKGKGETDGGYRRSLDIEKGVAECRHGDVCKEAWVSHPDRVAAYRWRKKERADLRLALSLYGGHGEVCRGKDGLTFYNHAWEDRHCDDRCGVLLGGAAAVDTDGVICEGERGKEGSIYGADDVAHGMGGGSQDGSADFLCIRGATVCTVYLAMETDFHREEDGVQGLQKKAWQRAFAAREQGYAALKERHTRDVARYMRRCGLQLFAGADRRALRIPFLFQYGRYLLLSSSREDSVLPAHLQGVWNDNVACRIGWTCDMHLDINTQMNYWPAEVTNLPETAAPLFRWLEETVIPHGRRSARVQYGRPGWTAELVSNAWGFTSPYWAVPLAPCPTGGVWVLAHMWEHYAACPDRSFLRDRVYPAYRGAVEFFTAYVFPDRKGRYTCGPSISPENSFLKDGERFFFSNGCTYEIVMIRELFARYLEITEILDVKDDLRSRTEQILPGLLPYRVLADGTIAEWNHDYPSADAQHRHTSHLLGLFPFAQITPEETPELARAAERTMAKKLDPEENWEDTGWARSMLMLYEARLHHGGEAWRHICAMTERLLGQNGMVIHPPTRGAASFDTVYELDGNTGLTSCIAEMLLQSHGDRIRLLPALPEAWPSGRVWGLCARGGIEVSMAWEARRLTEAGLLARRDVKTTVVYGEEEQEILLKEGERWDFCR